MQIAKQNKAFTLIELMVVITIIGILSVWGIVTYIVQIQKARDSNRINDVAQLQSMVEEFYQDNSAYPVSQGAAASFGTSVHPYATKIPKDPKRGVTCNNSGTLVTEYCDYAYESTSDDNGIANGAYEISTAFESVSNILSKGVPSVLGNSQTSSLRYKIGVPATVQQVYTDVTQSVVCPANQAAANNPSATGSVTAASIVICGS